MESDCLFPRKAQPTKMIWLSIKFDTVALLASFTKIKQYIMNFAWEDQSEKVFYKCHIYASVLYCVVIEHPSVLY